MMRRGSRCSVVAVLLLGWLIGFGSRGLGGETDPLPDPVEVLEHVSAWTDRAIGDLSRGYGIPGAVYAISYRGSYITNGFGHESMDGGIEVDPRATRFRIASLSKSFVALAVLDLVEKGKLDLDEDVNAYLPFRIQGTYAEPITLHHLLTHTAGFEENNIGRAVRTPENAPSLLEYVRDNIPERVRPVGETCSYSNYGSALAGFVVERVAGVPFDHFVERTIFEPAGMDHSSFRTSSADRVAVGHEWQSDLNRAAIHDWDIGYPASMIHATGADLARYLMIHAESGRIGAEQIVSRSIIERMQSRAFTHHPSLAGSGYGFFERYQSGVRVLVHGGYWKGFVSQICIIPERNAGFFFSFSSDRGRLARVDLLTAMIDTILNATGGRGETSYEVEVSDEPMVTVDASRLAGKYRSCEHSRSTVERIAVLFDPWTVTAIDDQTIRFWGREFRRAAGQIFVPVAEPVNWAPGPLMFRTDDEGEPTHLLLGRHSFERVPWYETERFQMVYLAVPTAILLLIVLIWPLATFVASRRGEETRVTIAPQAVAARGVLWLVALLNPVFLIAIYFIVKDALGSNGGEFAYGVSPAVVALQVVPHVTSVLAIALAYLTVSVWRRQAAPPWWCAIHTLGTVAALTYLPFFLNWNLLGFRF